MAKKKLTMKVIEERKEVVSQYEEVAINDEWTLDVKKEWSELDIARLITDYVTVIQKRGNSRDFNLVATPYMFLLILKYFTSLGEDIPNDFNGQLDLLEGLIADGLMVDIMEALPEDRVLKVEAQMLKFVSIVNETMDKVESEAQKLDIVNEEVRKTMINGVDVN